MLPWEVQVAAIYRGLAGANPLATWAATNASIARVGPAADVWRLEEDRRWARSEFAPTPARFEWLREDVLH